MFRKLLIPIIVLVLIYSCSKNESVQTVPKETITLEEGLDIDYDDLTVVTMDGEGDIDEDGGFDVSTNSNKAEGLPVIIMKGEEPWFGYYPNAGSNDNITLDDMLFFYISMIPEIGMVGLSDSEIVALMTGSPNYQDLKDYIKTSLNSNQSPLKNNGFLNLLTSTIESSLNTPESKIGKTHKGDFIGEFKFSHTRDGEISWPEMVPLFANVGFDIINEGGEVIFGPHIIESNSITLSPVAGAYWVYNELFGEQSSDEVVTSFKFNPGQHGDYTIRFTNGRNATNSELGEVVHQENKRRWIALVLQQAVPMASTKVFKKLKLECGEQYAQLLVSIGEKAYEQVLLNSSPSALDMLKTLDDVAIDVLNMSVECVGSASWGTWFRRMLLFVDVFNRAGKMSELMFNTRDWIGSDIFSSEEVYFHDGISFGYLKLEGVTPREFNGNSGSEHLYEAIVKEQIVKYEVRRGLKESTFTQQTEFVEAHGLSFDVNKVSGDGKLKYENPHETQTGSLFVDFIMGKEDSEFEITPSFTNDYHKYGLVKEIINLKPTIFNYEGTWYVKTFIEDDGSGTGSGNFWLYWEHLITFDSNGYAEGVLSKVYSAADYTYVDNSYNLTYDTKNSLLGLSSRGATTFFIVNSVDDTVFYSTGGPSYFKYELYRQ